MKDFRLEVYLDIQLALFVKLGEVFELLRDLAGEPVQMTLAVRGVQKLVFSSLAFPVGPLAVSHPDKGMCTQ